MVLEGTLRRIGSSKHQHHAKKGRPIHFFGAEKSSRIDDGCFVKEGPRRGSSIF